MPSLILRFALAVASLLLFAHATPFAGQIVPGKWIVTLKPDADAAVIASHFVKVREIHARNVGRRRGSVEREAGGIERRYGFKGFKGYAGSFDDATVEELRGLDEVVTVEEDTIMTTSDMITQINTENWGLAAISSRTKDATNYIYDSTAGQGTYNYVIDTGVRISHYEFESTRAIWGHNAVNALDTDNWGHGTHVAGIIAGKTYGVAKNSTIIAIKVFESASGTTSTVLAGFTWAVADIVTRNRTSTAVINLSLSGSASVAWDAAITAAWTQGVLAVVAAGNENRNASLNSPARSPEVICVGNLQRDDARFAGSTGSNYGAAVGIWAPGTGIVSSYHTSDDAIQVLSGTSMAAPHVAGLVSYVRGLEGPMSGEKVKARVLELGIKGRVVDARGGADLVAFNGVGEDDGDGSWNSSSIRFRGLHV